MKLFQQKTNNIEMKQDINSENIIHNFFEIGILIKGIDGLLQIIGGFLLIFFSPVRLGKLIVFITQRELLEDPNDSVSHYLLKLSNSFSINAQHFAVIYLIAHGLIKFILYLLLVKNKKGAYPLAIISLSLFVIYQLYRYLIGHSAFMLVLTLFDILMIILTAIEYKNKKKHLK